VVLPSQDPFLNYYQDELAYLRHEGRAFSKKYPKIARALSFSEKESADPHVERLLESFAFLSARLRQAIDSQYPETVTALLDALHPHLLNPIPAMGILELKAQPTKVAKGYTLPRHTPLSSYSKEDIICRFRTVYSTTLWPLSIQSLKCLNNDECLWLDRTPPTGWSLNIRLQSQAGSFGQLIQSGLDRLRFFIHADRHLAHKLYKNILAHTHPLAFLSTEESKGQKLCYSLGENSLQSVGFRLDEMALPTPAHHLYAPQLLQEFFHCPEKFFFFEIQGFQELGEKLQNTSELDLVLPIRFPQECTALSLKPDHLRLNCTPIVNLFSRVTDPLRLDYKKVHYPLIPDQRRQRTTEIYHIEKVTGIQDGQLEPEEVLPYFQATGHGETSLFWIARRRPSAFEDLPGTEIDLSFVNSKFDPIRPEYSTIYAHTLCTNRYLAEQLDAYVDFYCEEKSALQQARLLDRPVPQAYPPVDGDSLWKLVSSLNVNYQAFDSEHRVQTLKDLLTLYASVYPNLDPVDISHIQTLQWSSRTRRIGSEAWRGFVTGLEVQIGFKDSFQDGSSQFLLGKILRTYWSLVVEINHFIEVVLVDQESGEWMRWQPIIGHNTAL
jgi:type VI secretion system protein ImpG